LLDEINVETGRNVKELERVSSPLVTTAEKKKVINSFAEFLKSKATRLKQEALSAKSNFSDFFDALSFIIDMDPEFSDSQKHVANITAIKTHAEILIPILSQNRESSASFKRNIANLPRITIQFNQAKKLLIDAVDDCSQMFEEAEGALLRLMTKK
jgi:ABC-type transporter Mla subunit MlaD